jgi:predicted MFS family arabinose efflux permease
MTVVPSNVELAIPGRLEQMSTRVAFFIAGFGTAAWAPLVPFARTRAGLDEGELGLILLCLGIGSIISMPIAGVLASRLSIRRVIVVGVLSVCVTLPFLAIVSNIYLLAAAVLVFGASVGAVDCVMNLQSIIVERASGRAMMSGFHGLYSVGGIAGAGGVTALLSAGASPLIATLCVVAVILIALLRAAPHLLGNRGQSGSAAFAVPHGVVLFIGSLCFVVFLTEGAMLDWSAVFLISVRGLEPSFAGLGYAAFATTMTIGRLTGDVIVQKLGGVRVALFGGLCAACGLLLATQVATPIAGLLGFALVGAGCSNIVPVLYSAVGRQKIMPENLAVAAVSTMGYAGILCGPAGIGFLAHVSSLSLALQAVGVLMLGVAACSRLLGSARLHSKTMGD